MSEETLATRSDYPAGSELSTTSALDTPLKLFKHRRARKRWRYIGIYNEELMLCVGQAEVGLVKQNWWAVLDRSNGNFMEKTSFGLGGLKLADRTASGTTGQLALNLKFQPRTAFEVKTPTGRCHTWTRKSIADATGHIELAGRRFEISSLALIDDSAGHHPRHTLWRWSAGFGKNSDNQMVAWNFVSGINDHPAASEQAVWVGDSISMLEPMSFEGDLSAVNFAEGERLEFHPEAERSRRENLLVARSEYRQPFGTFSGSLPIAGKLTEGFGVMEYHNVYW